MGDDVGEEKTAAPILTVWNARLVFYALLQGIKGMNVNLVI